MTREEHLEPIYQQIGKKITAIREQRQMSRRALAEHIKVAATSVYRWEHAVHARIQIVDLLHVSRVLGVDVTVFFR